MAKFYYHMQNILDIKSKLEDSARQEYVEARRRLNEEEDKLQTLFDRKKAYYEAYHEAIQGSLDFLIIEELSHAMDIMDMMIEDQNKVVKKRSKELEQARQKMTELMQERKMHEKLKEKKFAEFLVELNATERRETDEVAGYQFSNTEKEVDN